MIPKLLHFIWVGDESRRPDNCIDTWRHHHPDWTIKVWGNDSLRDNQWVNAKHMTEMSRRELNGVADMMRWEILHRVGGVVLDADSASLRPLDEWLLDCEAFACWENEIARPGLIAAGYFGCNAENPFVGQIIKDIHSAVSVVDEMAWKTVGPQRLTDSYRRYQYQALRIYPSHYFIPEHFTGVTYHGTEQPYASQKWGSTRSSYDTLHLERFGDTGGSTSTPAPAPASPVSIAATTQKAPRAAAAPRKQPSLASLHAPYFVQRVNVSRELVGHERVEVFRKICAGKRVLHIGCADWPITDPATSLHLALEPHCAALDGFDVHEEALEGLRPHTQGQLFSRFEELAGPYDVVLVPEVMEHVPDVGGFLKSLDGLQAPTYVITVPDAFQCHSRHFEYDAEGSSFVEVVHPDHNCWYTPYTLTNVIQKFTPWEIQGTWFFNNISLLTIATRPVSA